MAATADLSLIIKAQNAASGVLKQIEGDVGGLGKMMSTGLKVGALAAAGGVGAAAFALKSFVGDAMETQKIMAQTNAVLASTHGAAGMSAQAVGDLANSLSKVIPIDDEVIQSAENMLLTFTNIGKDVFPQATETVLDMATALGEDTQSAAVQLGKALNDPIAGVTALRKVGVALTDQQREQIKVLVESGDVMGAQKIILKELQTEFGNSGRAAGETFAGKMKILNTQVGNIKESIGLALLPVLTKLADLATKYVVPAIEDGVAAMQDFVGVIAAALSGDLGKAAELFNKLPAPLQEVALWLAANKARLEDFVKGIGELALKVFAAAQAFGAWLESSGVLANALLGLKTIWEALQLPIAWIIDHKPAMVAALIAIGIAGALAFAPVTVPVLALIAALAALTVGVGFVRRHFDELAPILAGVAGVVVAVLAPAIVAWTLATWAQFTATAALAVATVIAYAPLIAIALAIGLVIAAAVLLVQHWDTIRDAFMAAVNYIGDLIEQHKVLAIVIAFLTGPIGLVVLAVVELIRHWDLVKSKAFEVFDFVHGKVDEVETAFWDVVHAVEAVIDAIGRVHPPDLGDLAGGVKGLLDFGFAGGGVVPGGLTLVGERGPEIAWLPGGTRVFSNDESRQMAAGGGTPIVQHIYIGEWHNVGDSHAGIAAMGAAV